MPKTWEEIIKAAKKKTNEQLATDIAGLSKLTQAEVDQIAPSALDKETLAKLMEIVKDSTKNNQEKAQAIKNVDQFLMLLISVADLVT